MRFVLPLAFVSSLVGACAVPPRVVAAVTPAASATSKNEPPREPCAGRFALFESLRETMHVELHSNGGAAEKILRRFEKEANGGVGLTVSETDDPDKNAIEIHYRGREEKLTIDGATKGLALSILDKMRDARDVADGRTYRIGLVGGHGERRLEDPELVPAASGRPSLRGVIEQYFPQYRLVDVDARRPFPADLAALVVLQPTRDWTDEELTRLDAAVVGGTPAVFAVGAVNVATGDVTMKATLDRHRVDRVLSSWGFDVGNDAVLEFGRSWSFTISTGTGETGTARIPTVARVKDDERFSGDEELLDTARYPFVPVADVALPYASSLTTKPARQREMQYRVLARSTPKATIDTAPTQDFSVLRRWKPSEPFLQVGLAASGEGRLNSAFGHGRGAAPARVLVIASSMFFSNPFVVALGARDDDAMTQFAMTYAQTFATSSILAAKSALAWATDREDLRTCVSTP